MKLTVVMTAIVPVLLAGCASIVDGSTQSVSVVTIPHAGAECKLANDKGNWYVKQTPGSVSVQRAYSPLKVTCGMEAWAGEAQVESITKNMAFGNILFGGPIGAGVDMGTGAAYDYPNEISVTMVRPISQTAAK